MLILREYPKLVSPAVASAKVGSLKLLQLIEQNNSVPKITALAITFNEEEHIKRYVESLSFADEIIIVDSFSTDATPEIAKQLGVQFIQNEFKDFSSQRNLG